jgi:hypothetical protein
MRVSKELLTLNIYDFPNLAVFTKGLKNRTEWLPALDEFRNFYFSPQASLGLTLSDIDEFLVA